MDGVLLIDKPAGPTSHDVVQRLRRTTRERGIGHTGTLDPAATGLLPLVFGRATRLAFLFAGAAKSYDATVRLGFATDTDDGAGRPIAGGNETAIPASDDEIRMALDRFRGTFDQVPPAHSAKKIAGERAYDLARRDKEVVLKPVSVTVHRLDWIGRDGDRVRLHVQATAGFYVRALARDLGAALGCGAHLDALRRTASGAFALADAIPLDEAERLGRDLGTRLLRPADALPGIPAVSVTELGWRRARHGNPLGPEHLTDARLDLPDGCESVKILSPEGELVAIGRPTGAALHPVVVLG